MVRLTGFHRLIPPLLALWLLGALSIFAQSPASSPSLADRFVPGNSMLKKAMAEHVKAELLADVQSITPGRPFRLGVRYRLDPAWHIYWRNSGDVGFATQIEWSLPPGFQAGELQWPAPERIEQAGLISFGYEHEVLLFMTVTPPVDMLSGSSPFKFSVKTDWVACKETCIPGDASLNLALPVSPGGAAAQPSAAAPDFDRFAALVPVSPSPEAVQRLDLQLTPARLSAEKDKTQPLTLTVRPRAPWEIGQPAGGAPGIELFPAAPESWEASHPIYTPAGPQEARFEWTLTPRLPEASTATLQAVLILPLFNKTTNEQRTERLSLPLPIDRTTTATSAAPVVTPTATSGNATGGSAGAKPNNQSSAPTLNASGLSFLDAHPQPGPSGHSFGYYLLLAFLGGLILNVMPCVLPVISLKITGFVRQAGEDRARIQRLGLVYALGVLASFMLMALALIALKAAGTQVGWGFQFQDPRFGIIMSAVVVAFALSLFGVYSVELPGSAAGRLDAVSRREGYGGAFMSGVLATALATPCSAPFLGPALGFALTQPSSGIILAFFVTIGLGLAAPYVLLTANPGWLRRLPRPGAWMETFKQFMGFMLLGTLVWLLHGVGAQLGPDGLVLTLAFLLAVALACWLLGRGMDPRASRRRWRGTLVSAICLTIAAYWVFPERYLRDSYPARSSGLPAPAADPGHQVDPADPVGGTAFARPAGALAELVWEPFSLDRVEELVRQGRTVFVDFTAEWCLTCKANEKLVLSTARVHEAFARHQVALLKADWTRRDATIGRVLEQLGGSGVPLYVIFPAHRANQPLVLPTVLTPGVIEAKLREASVTPKI